jgi:tRNA threonylcarbamoyladenosine biosynthesis protein TsaB
MNHQLIIQIETATVACSVALAKDGEVLGVKLVNERNRHAEVVTLFAEELIKEAGLTYNDLDAIAISSGPGSYTGLRIGTSTAKGLCFALDKPLIAIETLQSMASGIINREGYVYDEDMLLCPMIDARRMEVYTAIFTTTGETIKSTAAEIIDENSFSNLLIEKKVLFFGDGAEKCKDVLSRNPNALFYDGFVNSAADLTLKAAAKYGDKEFVDVAYFEPYYLKDFIAGKKAL